MRTAFTLFLITLSVSLVRAQEQEQRLVDRLLQPNTTLKNSAQEKKFVPLGKDKKVEKQATVQSFYISRRPETKEFADRREYSSTEFAAHHFRDGEIKSTVQARAARVKKFRVNDGTGALVVQDVSDGEKQIASSGFSASRPFLGKGKSQKALSQHNRPLTIDEVRELLNKNK